MEKKLDRLDQPHEVETTKVNKSRKRTREQNKENDTPAKKRKTPAKQAPAKQAPKKKGRCLFTTNETMNMAWKGTSTKLLYRALSFQL